MRFSFLELSFRETTGERQENARVDEELSLVEKK